MRLKKVYLKNIRSYDEGEIVFPEGSVLLSGDIGSGKTTVLLALEFAIFGLQRGILSGGALLKNGKDRGIVKVFIEIEGKEIIIERTLKKSRDSVVQDSGFLTVDDERKELSATELKNDILNRFKYPKEFLTKTDVLYRYTVYAPQESMKEILIEKPEARLETLRRVFGIDKYKALSENVGIFLSKLRESIKNKEGKISQLDSKKHSLNEAEKNLSESKSQLSLIKEDHEKSIKELNSKKQDVLKVEKDIVELNKKRTELARKKSEFESVTEQLVDLIERTKIFDSQIANMKESLKGLKIDTVEAVESALTQQQNEINRLQSMHTELEKKISELKAKKHSKEELAKGINSLSSICPVCKQKVTQEHKHDFILKNEEESAIIEAALKKYTEKSAETLAKLEESKGKLKDIQAKDKDMNNLKINLHRLEEKEMENMRMKDNKERLQSRHEILKREIKQIETNISANSEIEKEYRKHQQALELFQDHEKKMAIKNAQTEKEIEGIESLIRMLKKEIADMEKTKDNLLYLIKLRNWLQDKFIPLTKIIEQEVMAKVYHEFSQVFNKWFGMLVSGLLARLDDNFTPIISYNGHDMEYDYLSGGERTAAALAYRLALNQVINGMMSRIKTKDMIILDEPTDGFSSEQLDKMRDVLHELKATQIILVSHEAKIESFVDNIIRFRKESGVTKVER